MFTGKQWFVVANSFIASILSIFVGYLFRNNAVPFVQTSFPPDLSDGERLTYAFRCLVFSALPLFMAIQRVGSFRFNNMETLGAQPTAPVDPSQKAFMISERILQNTMEQLVFHVLAVLAVASTVEVDQLVAIPCMVFLFVIGRTAFSIGYLHFDFPLARDFGYGLTIFPTLCGAAYATYIISSRAIFG